MTTGFQSKRLRQLSENNGWVGRGAGVGVCVLWQGGGGGGTEGAGGVQDEDWKRNKDQANERIQK